MEVFTAVDIFSSFYIEIYFHFLHHNIFPSKYILTIFSVSVPLTPLSTFMGKWVFGEALCKLLPASQVTLIMMMEVVMVDDGGGFHKCRTGEEESPFS